MMGLKNMLYSIIVHAVTHFTEALNIAAVNRGSGELLTCVKIIGEVEIIDADNRSGYTYAVTGNLYLEIT